MSNFKTFNENDAASIKSFADNWSTYDQNDEAFLIFNITKAINLLNNRKENEYKTDITYQLFRVIANLGFQKKTDKFYADLLNTNLYSMYEKEINFNLNQTTSDCVALGALFRGLNSLTSCSKAVENENVRRDLAKDVLKLFNKEKFLEGGKLNNDDFCELYDKIVSFFYVGTFNATGKVKLLEYGLVNILTEHVEGMNKYYSNKHELRYTKMNIVNTLAYLLTDDQMNKLPISDDLVSTIIAFLKEAIDNGSRNKRQYKGTLNYTTFDTKYSNMYETANDFMSYLIKISVSDQIKQKVLDAKIFDLIEVFLRNENITEKKTATELICSLCFIENAKKILREKESYMRLIKDIAETSKDDDTKRSCYQIIQMVNNILEQRIRSAKNPPAPSSTEPKKTGHIMISYNHKYKTLCSQISEELKKREYTTWMDIENSFTDLRDTLAKAIETAAVILICYSQDYKDSGNCRYEAEYAVNLNKPIIAVRVQDGYNPDGWLGMILAAKFYVNLSLNRIKKDLEIDPKIDPYNDLWKQLDCILGMKKESTTQVTPTSARPPSSTQRPPSRVQSAKPIENARKWNSDQVKNWLASNNLESFITIFSKYNGIALKGLWECKQKDYSQFCTLIDKEIEKSKIEVELHEKFMFYELLQELFQS